ncbi:MAG: universal stress protein [Geminicoccaceae bacterium]
MIKSLLLVPTVELDVAAGPKVAIALARRFGGAVDDLYIDVASQTETAMALGGEGGIGWYVADLQEREDAWRASVMQLVAQERSAAGVPGRSLQPHVPEATANIIFGGAHDLIVIDVPTAGGVVGALEGLRNALFESTRPVLVVPPGAAAPERHALIVLGETVPAVRALHASLPLIEGFAKITVLANCGDEWRDAALELLRRHGHAPEIVQPGLWSSSRDRGRMVLRTAGDVGADLIVMGAYAAGRLARLVGMGGATEKVVTGTKVPVLLMH